MRPRLLQPLRERSYQRREHGGHDRRPAQRREPRVIVIDVEPGAEAGLPSDCDRAAEQVRRAGGPLDEATYTCTCGYLFSAAVSTTVACPHCGAGQAW
jgi:hypothetical protein